MFKAILYSRENARISDTLKEIDVFSRYLHRIILLPQPEVPDAFSFSKVRQLMLTGESCHDMLCPGVWDLFKRLHPADSLYTINWFKGEYDFLSNRFACQFVWQGLIYNDADAAFQSSKCVDEQQCKVFSNCSADKDAEKGSVR